MIDGDGNSSRCPYIEHEPQSIEGHGAWELVLTNSSQFRSNAMGEVIGLETSNLLTLAGYQDFDLGVMAKLIPAIERGLMQAINGKKGVQND